MRAEETLYLHVHAFVDELARAGIRDAVVCPGSRSTPLAMLLEGHSTIAVWMHYDERSAAYFALGMAKAAGVAVVLVCTSGTAAANFLPAVVEAQLSRVPLVVLTADRSPELQDVGAPQTIDQRDLYGRHVKWFAQSPVPDEAVPVRHIRAMADRAVATSLETPAGPVHVNLPFREPLIPVKPREFRSTAGDVPTVSVWPGRVSPETTSVHSAPNADPASSLRGKRRGLIVCGPTLNTREDWLHRMAVPRLQKTFGYPVLADPLSGLRSGEPFPGLVTRYDAFLRDADTAATLAPDAVIRLGAVPTSKALQQFLEHHRGHTHILIDPAGWNDPLDLATSILRADPYQAVQYLEAKAGGEPDGAWQAAWRQANNAADGAIQQCLAGIGEPFEGKALAELASLLPEQAVLWVGSSMPIRDADTFLSCTSGGVQILANRGANGIDGVVSSALGAAARGRPTVLVIGDLSFYHDLNGLLADKLHGIGLTILLLNNNGGGIFSFLPQHGTANFEILFGTPHDLDFEPAVRMYGGSFRRVDTWPDFRSVLQDSIGHSDLRVIEMRTERERNVELHREVWQRVSEALHAAEGVAP